MIETLIVILLLCWVAGLLTGYSFGGIIHALIVIALALLVYRLLTGRTPRV